MDDLLDVRHIDASIRRRPSEVYEYASNPEHLPHWAAGIGGTVRKTAEGDWVALGPMGTVKIRFVEPNSYGVLDHDVVLESGQSFHNPMRVVPNASGSTLIFTLFRQPGVSDEDFTRDALTVERDLLTLKNLLEA